MESCLEINGVGIKQESHSKLCGSDRLCLTVKSEFNTLYSVHELFYYYTLLVSAGAYAWHFHLLGFVAVESRSAA